MALRLYNTLHRRKETFEPIDPANVRVYACGPTVYDDAHIGNARPIIVFDLLFRVLRHLYGAEHVTYVRNVTDVDDKINARAYERGITIRELTEGTHARFHEDIRPLGVIMPEESGGRMIEPRATDHIAEMRELIERLIASGHAYVAEDHVLFHVPSMPDYGELSKRPLDEMEAGARVDVAPFKKSPLDFVLWKPSGERDPAWPSPGGIAREGRPGWHIECSAMSWRHLGKTFDIHAGGIDLVFPHHENEIAQTRCAFAERAMANVWLHNGFLQVEGQKMAKSAGNFVTIRELLRTETFGGRSWPGDVLRLAMLQSPYREPLDWTVARLVEAENVLVGFWRAIGNVAAGEVPQSVLDALTDDLDTPRAITALHELKREEKLAELHGALSLMGFAPVRFSSGEVDASTDFSAESMHRAKLGEEAWALLAARVAARKARNFAESDRLRDALASLGVSVKDAKDRTHWEIKR